MKGFSPWPGRVALPTPELKPPKKAANVQCIYFFGTNNYAWIEDVNIKPYQEHKEQLIKSSKSAAFKEAINQIEEYIINPEKFADIDGHARDPEEEFDKLKQEPLNESEIEEIKKKTSTPKIRLGISKVKPIKRSSSAGLKSVPKKKSKRSMSRSLTDTDIPAEKPSMLNHSFSKKSSLLHRPSNIIRPTTPPLDLENVSETLLEKNIQASQMKFGFLGLGIMGSGIVKNLLNSGHKVVVWNRTAGKILQGTPAKILTADIDSSFPRNPFRGRVSRMFAKRFCLCSTFSTCYNYALLPQLVFAYVEKKVLF
ncbi:Putative oxidoreductase GLYR1 homolog [Eumeta japonica]|uniref:Oxidoreductase GLYR1 homolog n=1 Tax=Eumeta variegata TaxID=151549 RepID=A0A4C1WAD0_EUMVA|nr:Putative oxidoreductase GLYR1 homolog [Eumeta japonica]